MTKADRDAKDLAHMSARGLKRITLRIPESLERWYKHRAAKDRKAHEKQERE